MSNFAVVLVHGMGTHRQSWSQELQSHLAGRLSPFLSNLTFFETVYSDLVEGVVEIQSERTTAEAQAEQTAIAVDVARLDATVDAVLGPADDRAEVTVSGDMKDTRRILHDLQAYVVRYFKSAALRAAIHSRLLETIGSAVRSVGGKQNLILLGHSLGSAIVWNLTADEPSVAGLHRLITLACPLGWFQRAGVIQQKAVRGRWINAGTPADIVCHQEIGEPFFWATEGLVSVRTRRFQQNPHSGLITDPDIVADWAPIIL